MWPVFLQIKQVANDKLSTLPVKIMREEFEVWRTIPERGFGQSFRVC